MFFDYLIFISKKKIRKNINSYIINTYISLIQHIYNVGLEIDS